jgi:hypothetical protein
VIKDFHLVCKFKGRKRRQFAAEEDQVAVEDRAQEVFTQLYRAELQGHTGRMVHRNSQVLL